MIKNYLTLCIYFLCFTACASWPWKYTEDHGKLKPGQSVFSQISDAMEASEQTTGNDRCTFIAESGLCKATFKRYFFNQETQKCDSFIWGGCDGLVPFETLEECIDSCE